jgi:ABC-2 type transport system permease protein
MSDFLWRVRAIARSELLQLRREPRSLFVIFAEPVMLLILYGYCISFDLRELPFAVWDQDRSAASRALTRDLDRGGDSFALAGYVRRPAEIEPLLAAGRVRFVLVIRHGFARDLDAGRPVEVQALFDGADSNTAGVAAGYLAGAVAAHSARLQARAAARLEGAHDAARPAGPALGGSAGQVTGSHAGRAWEAGPIQLRWRVLYNPDLSSRRFIIPGLVAVLLSVLAATLTATTITRERELASIEFLLASPVRAPELVFGKMLPYVALALGNVVLVVLLSWLAFGMWPRGSLLTLAAFTLLFLPGMLAVGMAISAAVPTQQLALVLAILTTILPSIFLTGFIFPRSNMAWILQQVSWPFPATQYLIAVRAIFLKGADWNALWPHALWLAGSGTALVAAAIGMVGANLARGLR